jgi:hypothetical protein
MHVTLSSQGEFVQGPLDPTSMCKAPLTWPERVDLLIALAIKTLKLAIHLFLEI